MTVHEQLDPETKIPPSSYQFLLRFGCSFLSLNAQKITVQLFLPLHRNTMPFPSIVFTTRSPCCIAILAMLSGIFLRILEIFKCLSSIAHIIQGPHYTLKVVVFLLLDWIFVPYLSFTPLCVEIGEALHVEFGDSIAQLNRIALMQGSTI